MNKTKAPIKYLMATSVLKLTESDEFNNSKKLEPNILYILKVLQSNLKSLDQSHEDNFENAPAIKNSDDEENDEFDQTATRLVAKTQNNNKTYQE